MLTQYDRTEQAIERAIPYFKHLVSQATLPDVALWHAAQRFGIRQERLRHALSEKPTAPADTLWGGGSTPDLLSVGSVPLSTSPFGENG